MMNRPNPSDLPNRRADRAARVLLTAIAASALALGACKKKEPEPEPAPPPPPPPPAAPLVVSFDSVSQELGVDSRVQFAPGLEVTDPEFAKAAVRLADAIARGDVDKMRPLVSRPVQAQITEMKSSGVWDAGMGDIEAVRVVYAAPVKADEEGMTLEKLGDMFKAPGEGGLPAGMTPELAYQIGKIMGQAMGAPAPSGADAASFSPENMEKIMAALNPANMADAFQKFLNDPQHEEARKQVQALLTQMRASSNVPAGEYVVLLAVQHKDGAELSGWGGEKAFERWTFNNGTTIPETKPRAMDFDGVGLAGFRGQSFVPPVAGADGAAGGGAPTPGQEAPAKPDEPKKDENPIKRTPSGPVKIPAPGGG